jgi:hypothetical protein
MSEPDDRPMDDDDPQVVDASGGSGLEAESLVGGGGPGQGIFAEEQVDLSNEYLEKDDQ